MSIGISGDRTILKLTKLSDRYPVQAAQAPAQLADPSAGGLIHLTTPSSSPIKLQERLSKISSYFWSFIFEEQALTLRQQTRQRRAARRRELRQRTAIRQQTIRQATIPIKAG